MKRKEWLHWGVWLLTAAALLGYWLLPISGGVVVWQGESAPWPWPLIQLEPSMPRAGQPLTIRVTDEHPRVHVALTINGAAQPVSMWGKVAEGRWGWTWEVIAPAASSYEVVFYSDCHEGCVERGRAQIGTVATPTVPVTPTKLCVVFPNPERDWHNRSGWGVEVAYVKLADDPYWGLDGLAQRVYQDQAAGLRVLVRVDYAQGQSLPGEANYLELDDYLAYMRRLARDQRFRDGVYGYIIGADLNVGQTGVSPAWYARLFNGYGEAVSHSDNVVQTVRAENPTVRLLVGPVRPWCMDRDGEKRAAINVPWLNYMNTLAAALDEGGQAKAGAGIALARPDGFDIQAPGHPESPEMRGRSRAEEPRLDLARAEWKGAQAGFGVYRDWLTIINSYEGLAGLPVYIISTNTYDRESNIPPAQNYPQGWLSTAAAVIDGEPQVQALCWFMDDFPDTEEWDYFSLTRHPGRLVDAAEEFDRLLRGQ